MHIFVAYVLPTKKLLKNFPTYLTALCSVSSTMHIVRSIATYVTVLTLCITI